MSNTFDEIYGYKSKVRKNLTKHIYNSKKNVPDCKIIIM